MKRVLSAFALLSLIAFASPALADDIPSTLKTDTSGNLPAGLTFEDVTGIDTSKSVPGATYKVERVLTWNEGNGTNLAVFAISSKVGQKDDSTYESRVLYVTTFSELKGVYTKVQANKEAVRPCDLDLTLRFIPESITLTNLDGDDQGELSFGYVAGCRGDMSSDTMKLLMLEQKAKYALRGESVVDYGDGMKEGGTYKADFKKAPPAFFEHAKKLWALMIRS